MSAHNFCQILGMRSPVAGILSANALFTIVIRESTRTEARFATESLISRKARPLTHCCDHLSELVFRCQRNEGEEWGAHTDVGQARAYSGATIQSNLDSL
jgi:hypothetical protein